MKYTKQELKEMAEDYLLAMRSRDPRHQFLLMNMMMRTGLSQEAVQYKIEEFALWEDPEASTINPEAQESV